MKIVKVLLLFLVGFSVYSQEVISVSKGEQKYAGKYMSFFVDESNALGIEDAAKQDYIPVENDILNLSFIPHTVWVKFEVRSLDQSNLYLEINQAMIEELEVYARGPGSNMTTIYQGGFSQVHDSRPIVGTSWLFDLPVQQEATTIYIKGRTGYPFQMPVLVTAKEKYVESIQKYKTFWGIYIGIMIFAFLYNLFIFISLKERTYFYYILYILGSTVFYLGLYGMTFEYLWPDAPGLNPYLPIIICVTNIIITLFTMRFLQISKVQRVSYYGSWVIMVGFGLIALLNLFGPYQAAIGLAQMFSLVTALFFIYLGISSWRRNVPTAKFYLVAWTIYLVFVIIFLLADNNVLPSNFFTRHCIFIGHMTEVLLLSLALADRINWLKRDNEKKQRKIIDQLEEKEQIQLQANQLLEQKVVERTKEVVEQRNEAVKQRERSDELLLNILPEETAQELKTTGQAKAKYFENVSVLFADVQDFTRTAENLDPSNLVEKINQMFTAFDDIVDKYNIEKIKTIGDAYLAVGGLPSPNQTHAEDIINAGIEFQKAISSFSKDSPDYFQVRIGIHTGPVVAGVVGKKKFAYDVWGNTVNVASRIESASEVGKINISEDTYKEVKDKFKFIERGKIQARNVGMINMYFVDF